MSSLSLVAWIVLGVALQLGLYLGFWFWRRWGDYQALGLRTSEVPGRALAAGDAWSSFREFRVERKIVEDAERAVCSFHLAPTDGQALPAFRPGQFLTFRLDIPGPTGATEQVLRCYSLSDAPGRGHYRISIKRVPPAANGFAPGRSSSFFHDEVVVGSLLQVRAPAGHFHLERGDAPMVLIGGGIGITPMMSMLEWCLAEQPGREVWLFYGVRHERELVMAARLEALAALHKNFRLRFCISGAPEAAASANRHAGRIDIGLLRAELPLKPYHFYVCGPAALLESLVPALEEWGVPPARIHFEAFGPSSLKRGEAAAIPAAPDRDVDIDVRFSRSGKELKWQPAGGSLLEFAEANGVTLDCACRAGACGTCQTAIGAGEVSYRQTPEYEAAPGTCLPCVCVPKTNLVLEA